MHQFDKYKMGKVNSLSKENSRRNPEKRRNQREMVRMHRLRECVKLLTATNPNLASEISHSA